MGYALVLPVIRNMFYLNVLQHRGVAFEHLVPLRILFPTDNQVLLPHTPLQVSGIEKQRRTSHSHVETRSNYTGHAHTSRVPTNWWGREMLLLTQEIRQVQESINGMTVPQACFGG